MDWRPFASAFAQNTFEDFCKKVDSSLELFKPKVSGRAPLCFYRPTDQEVEEEMLKFQDLRKRVVHQRKEIKLRDTLLQRAQQHRDRERSRRLLAAKSTRKAYNDQVRSFASCTPRPITTLQVPKQVRKQHTNASAYEDEPSFFLTAAEDKGEKRSARETLLPPVRGARSDDNAGDLSFFTRRGK